MSVAFVTGADGFIGRHLVDHLRLRGWQVIAAVRASQGPGDEQAAGAKVVAVGDLAATDIATLVNAMADVDVIYHLAGRAHRPDAGRAVAEKSFYDRDNLTATQRVYTAARSAGARRFIYVSTIKVLGETSAEPLVEDAPPAPPDVYAASKLAAERWLLEQSDRPAISIVRPPLVYGPGVKGNMAALIGWVTRGRPLPLGLARAPRSMVAVKNLVDLLVRAADDEAPARIFHVRDDVEPTAADLARQMGAALGVPVRLWNVPPILMRWVMWCARRPSTYAALFEPYRVDDSTTRRVLAWQPPQSIESAMADMVEGMQ